MKLDPSHVGKRCKMFGASKFEALIVAISADRKTAFVDTKPDDPNLPAKLRLEEVEAGRIASIVGEKVRAA